MMRHSPAFLREDDGLGMTELAVAILVLGIVLVGLFPLVVDSIRLAMSNAEVGQANRAVASNVDRVRTANPGGECSAIGFTGTAAQELLVAPPAGFSGEMVMSCADGAGKLVTVTVSVWRDSDGADSLLSTAVTKVVAP